MKYFTTFDYNNCIGKIPKKKIKVKGLIFKFDVSGYADNSDLDEKIATLAKESRIKQ